MQHTELITFTENLVKSLVKQPEMVSVQEFLGDDEVIQLEIIVQMIWVQLLVKVERWHLLSEY